jgi:hypothetical protein
MSSILNLGAKLVADANQYISDMQKAGQATDGTQSSIQGLGAQAVGATAGIAVLTKAAQEVGKYLIAAEQAADAFNMTQAKQDAILKATGGDAGVTANELKQLTDELSREDGVTKEVVMDSESMMLTFTNISDNVFPRAVKDAFDLQTVFGSVESATKALGLALNDPTNGLTALSRVGIRFDADQKTQIDNFVAENNLAAAQGIILDIVEKKFGGTAQAMEKASDGSDRLKVSSDNLSVSIGETLTPPLKTLNDFLASLLDKYASDIQFFKDLADATNEVAKAEGLNVDQMQAAMMVDPGYRAGIEAKIQSQLHENQQIDYYNTIAPTQLQNIKDMTAADQVQAHQLEENAALVHGLSNAIQQIPEVKKTTIEITTEYETALTDLDKVQAATDTYNTDLTTANAKYMTDKKALDNANAAGWYKESKLYKDRLKAVQDDQAAITGVMNAYDKTTNGISQDILLRKLEESGLTAEEAQEYINRGEDLGLYTKDAEAKLAIINQVVQDYASSWNKLFVDRKMTVAIDYTGGGGGGGQNIGGGQSGGGQNISGGQSGGNQNISGGSSGNGTIAGGAGGGDMPGGLAIVGEKGEELVNLPPGSHVYPNDETKKMLRALGVPGMMMGYPPAMRPDGGGYEPQPYGGAAAQTDSEKKSDQRSAKTEDSVTHLADTVTFNQQDVQKSNMELKSTITDLKDAIKKMQVPQIDYARLTRAIRDANQQVGLR